MLIIIKKVSFYPIFIYLLGCQVLPALAQNVVFSKRPSIKSSLSIQTCIFGMLWLRSFSGTHKQMQPLWWDRGERLAWTLQGLTTGFIPGHMSGANKLQAHKYSLEATLQCSGGTINTGTLNSKPGTFKLFLF